MQATQYAIDLRTLTPSSITYFGVYGEDFLTYAEFSKDYNPDDEATLLKIFEEDSDAVLDKHTFKFDENQKVSYSREVTGKDTELEHPIEETHLNEQIRETWTETFFYGVGNKSM